jgi:hypothetical protein
MMMMSMYWYMSNITYVYQKLINRVTKRIGKFIFAHLHQPGVIKGNGHLLVFSFIQIIRHIKWTNSIKKDIIFPLALHPITTLWLSAPRNVHRFLNVLPKKKYYFNLSIDEKCFLISYSHRDEKLLHNYIMFIRIFDEYVIIIIVISILYSFFCDKYNFLQGGTPQKII